MIVANTQAGQNVSFDEMSRIQEQLNALVQSDPDVTTYSATNGGGGQTGNTGRMYINLKPWAERHVTVMQVIARLQQKAASVEGAQMFMQPAQDINVGDRQSRTMYQYTLQDSDNTELNAWVPKILDAVRKIPGLTSVRLIVSQSLTLYTTPVIYLYLDALQRWMQPRRVVRLPTLRARMDAVGD